MAGSWPKIAGLAPEALRVAGLVTSWLAMLDQL